MPWNSGDVAELVGGCRVRLLERAVHSTRYWWVQGDIVEPAPEGRRLARLDFVVAETDLKKVRE